MATECTPLYPPGTFSSEEGRNKSQHIKLVSEQLENGWPGSDLMTDCTVGTIVWNSSVQATRSSSSPLHLDLNVFYPGIKYKKMAGCGLKSDNPQSTFLSLQTIKEYLSAILWDKLLVI